MIYVDLLNFSRMLNKKTVRTCHLWSDKSTEELMEFGKRLGLAGIWVHTGDKGVDHFDLMPFKRVEAVRIGAKEVDCIKFKEPRKQSRVD